MLTAILPFAFLALVLAVVWLFWRRIAGAFRDSETLFFARVQMVVGAVLTVLGTTDLTPVLHMFGLSWYVPLYLIASGIITEYLRRARASL